MIHVNHKARLRGYRAFDYLPQTKVWGLGMISALRDEKSVIMNMIVSAFLGIYAGFIMDFGRMKRAIRFK